MADRRKLTPRQRVALEHTCKLPEETRHPRFYRLIGKYGTVLTLNSGFE